MIVAILLLALGVGILGWSNYATTDTYDSRIGSLAHRVDELSRANGIKDQQLQQAGIPPSPLLTTTTTTHTRTTATTIAPAPRTPTTTASTSPTTVPPSQPTTTTTVPTPPTTACVSVLVVKVCPN